MVKIPIRNLQSNKPVKPRVCDLVVDGNNAILEFKQGKTTESVPLDSFIRQVNEAKKKTKDS